MLTINIDEYPYSDPWIVPFEKRLSSLLRGELRVAYFYEQPNNSTFRYRAYNMAEALNSLGDGRVSASYFFLSDLSNVEQIVKAADLLVVCRSRYSAQLNCLIQRFRAQGKKVLFDVDDLVFDLDYVHVLTDSLGLDAGLPQVFDDWFAYIGRMSQSLKLCDGAITTNEFLATRITEFCDLSALVVPNFMNSVQQKFSDEIFSAKLKGDFLSDGQVTLGYFSGSPSHKLDFAIVAPALVELLEEDESLDLVVVGYIEPDASLERFSDRIRSYPFQDYVNLQKLIASVDINLVPLQDNVFTNCKSELKYFEAGAVGVPSVVSPVFTYRGAISDGQNGFLAKSYQWGDAIRRSKVDLSTGGAVASRARAHSLSAYSWDSQFENIMKALTSLGSL
ncbi:MAG TPA: glycosyltransferase [Halothiobacillus sp.]|nr:glycosyltransferase [Halothiobacillus sp.]